MMNASVLVRLAAFALMATPIASGAPAPANSDWALLGNSPEMQHHSTLAGINRGNVARLGLAWAADIPTLDGMVGNPLVKDGIVFQSGALGRIFANDVETGKLLWTFEPEHDFTASSYIGKWGPRVNRGVALWGDLVIASAGDCRLNAVAQKTGELRWTARPCDSTQEYAITAAPRVGGDLIFSGNACGDSGASRGHVDALDARTGEHRWRFYTVPGDPAEPQDSALYDMAAKTWGDDWYSKTRGCGSVWDAITYDPVLKQVYIGVGGPAPLIPTQRGANAGDELFTNSVVAQGRVLFEDACVGCHGHYGDAVHGAIPNLLTRPPASFEFFRVIVQDGALAARGMPQFAFSEAQAKAVYAFIVDSGWDAYEAQQEADSEDRINRR